MADDFELEADISIDVSSAVRDAKRLADSLADLNDATGNVDNNIDRLERAAASASGTLSRFTKESTRSADQALKQAKAINASVQAYQELARTQGKAVANATLSGSNPAAAVIKEANKQHEADIAYEREFSALVAAENKKREAEAKRSADELLKIDRELAAQRAAESRKSEQIIAEGRAQAAAKGFQAEERARQRELASLRDWMQNREKYMTQAYAENANRNVAAATRSLQGADFSTAFNSNAFDGLRESAAYADMMNESLRGLANQRYALYDVATTLGVVAAAATAAGTAAVVMGGQFDKAFGQVERTTGLTGSAAEDLRAQLVGITTELGGVNFQDVAGIATLGAQMNIADDALAGFTDTVAKFSATTDVSVDAAATGFGRLAQLTKTPQSEIGNLASAIYQTGINAVATESQILSVAEQIAVAGNLAGFTNTEIVALSSALASLGVAPEQSRGAFERIFGNFIPSAIAKGGEALQGFADLAGMSAEEFASTWESKPQEAFNAFLDGLSKVENQTLALRELGIVNVRDINVLNRLSANMDVYRQALTDTNQAYAENTALNEGVAIAQDNLIDRLSKLANSFKAMIAAAGQSDVLNGIVDMLLRISEALRSLVESPVGKTIAGIVLALTGLTAALTAAAAAFYLGKASLLAFVVALRSNVASSNGLTLSVRALVAELIKLSAVQKVASAGMGEMSAKSAVAATAVNGLKLALKGVLATTAIGAGFVLLTKAVEGVQRAFQSAGEVADAYFQKNNIDVSGFAEAIKQDTQALAEGGNAYRTAEVSVKSTQSSLSGLSQQIQTTTGTQIALNSATDTTSSSYQNLTTAIGDSTKALLAQKLAEDPAMQKLYEHRELADQLGLSFETMIQKMLTDPSGHGGSQYLDTFIEKAFSAEQQQGNLNAEYLAGQESLRQLQEGVRSYETEIQTQLTSSQIYNEALSAMGVEIEQVTDVTEDMAGANSEASDSLSDLVDTMFSAISGTADIQGALYDLGASLYENGNSFSAFSESGRANLDALQQTVSTMASAAGDDTEYLAQNIMGMMAQLQSMGVDTSNELGFLGNMLNELVGTQYGLDFNSTAARQDIDAFIQSAIAALQVRAQLERTSSNIAAAAQAASGAPFAGIVAGTMRAAGEVAARGYEQQAQELQGLKTSLTDFGKAGGQAGRAVGDGFKGAAREASNAGGAADRAGKAAKGAGDKAAKSAKDAQKEVRTLTDYANDLASVFDRQLEFSFGVSEARDDTADQIQDMKDKIRDARQAILDMKNNLSDLADQLRDARQKVRDFNAEIKGLRADRTTLEYQLKVSDKYGDSLRSAEIRAELAEKNEEIRRTENERADASKDVNKVIKEQNAAERELKKAQSDAAKGLKGNSQAARDNRAAVQDLVRSYADQLTQMAANGASQSQLRKKAGELRREFEKQLTQMGFNRSEVKKYSQEFEGFTEVIKKVPRNVTVTTKASTSAASRAINEFIKRQQQKTIKMKTKVSTPKSVGGGTYKPSKISVAGKTASGGTMRPSSINSRGPLSASSVNSNKANFKNIYAPGYWSTSGKPVGPFKAKGGVIDYLASGGIGGMHPGAAKGTDTVPAWLTPGEFVQQKKAVDFYGLDFMNAVNSLRFPAYLAQGSGGGQVLQSSGPAVQLVELMPNQVQQIVRAVQTTIKVDSQTLASSVNGSNRNNSVRGSN